MIVGNRHCEEPTVDVAIREAWCWWTRNAEMIFPTQIAALRS